MPIPFDPPASSQPNKRLEPSMHIVIDCKGQYVTTNFLRYTENLLARLRGSQYIENTFWITRHDLHHDFEARNAAIVLHLKLASEPRHEPSFDLYEDGGIVPIARLVNVAPARDWFGNEPAEKP